MIWFLSRGKFKELACKVCRRKSSLITAALPICRDCLKKEAGLRQVKLGNIHLLS